MNGKATRIKLRSFARPHMRAFHMAWMAFFASFFAWFAIAPLMVLVREDLGLTQAQIGNTVIASVAATIAVRILVGPLCDRFGPRLTFSGLLVACSIPVMGIGLATSYETFLLARLAIGAVGASFVVTQHHTSVMFAPNVIGTANAMTAGWGNLGGGVTQIAMPLVVAGVVAFGAESAAAWRLGMLVPGAVLLAMGIAYFRLTDDTPDGPVRKAVGHPKVALAAVVGDRRVWALFVAYAACFGVELTVNNVAALYYHDRFGLGLAAAGLVAGLFGLMNLFARAVGGFVSDRIALNGGLPARTRWLQITLVGEGVLLVVFSRMSVLAAAIVAMIAFSLFVQMAEGATYALVPFVNKQALGTVSGLVAAGGNVGAVAAGFLFRLPGLATGSAFLILGLFVLACAVVTFTIRFGPQAQAEEREEFALASASTA